MSRVLELAREAVSLRKLLRRLVQQSSVMPLRHLSPDATGFLVPAALWGEVFEASSPELTSYHRVMRAIAEGRRPTVAELDEAKAALAAKPTDDDDLLAAEAEYALSLGLCDND